MTLVGERMGTIGPRTAVHGSQPASLRAVPYPYRALLAICSDLDETPDSGTYYECARFLNTSASTRMGNGVGLEVGNTIYFDMAADQFAYWNTDDAGRDMVRGLIRSGHIDCLHSFGDLASTRAQAARSLDDLDRHGCGLAVWIDHAVAPTNVGADIMRGSGDVVGSAAYHADLTTAFGVTYVWRGRVTSVLGQDIPRRLAGIFDQAHPLASGLTFAREAVKGALARGGHSKYAMHMPNEVMRPAALRDGRRVTEFLRSNPHWGGVSRGDTAYGLAEVLTRRMLTRLANRGGTSILYTHLGKTRNPFEPFGPDTRRALRRLARFERDGQILVTTTRRLLDYCAARRDARVVIAEDAATQRINVSTPKDTDGRSFALDGLTVYVNDPARAQLFVDGRNVTHLMVRNARDAEGRASVSLPWPRLEFPCL